MFLFLTFGEVAEWLKALDSKSSMRETVSGVRIPLSPFALPIPLLSLTDIKPVKVLVHLHGEHL